jgi:lycopene cyclase domain-containing protein
MTYLVSLIPFAVVNGILTSLPVLIYKNEENLSFRIGTIPVEDFFYSMLLLLINITLYEQLKDKRKI